MKFYGIEKELVKDAILHDILSKQMDYRVVNINGKVIEKRGKLYLKTNLTGEASQISLGDVSDLELDSQNLNELNSENTKFAVVMKDGKLNLFISDGESPENAQENLDWQIIEDYVNQLNVKSKFQLEKLIKQYQTDLGFLMKGIRPTF